MIIKDLGAGVFSVWEGLRPMTKQLLVGQLESGSTNPNGNPTQKYSYDAHADWELSRLLSALDEQARKAAITRDVEVLDELVHLAETCARVLESQTASAEVFIQLAERALLKYDFKTLDRLADNLYERFSASEIAEIVRQTESPQIRAIAYETLTLLPVTTVAPLLHDSLYSDISANALEQKAVDYGSEEAREVLDQFDRSFEN
jgi:hypothetical protein